LVSNCPSLEVLDLSECKEIDDECVDVITSTLPRLKTLKLNRCDKISERTFEILYKNCTELRVRSVVSDHFKFVPDLNLIIFRTFS